MEERRIEKQVKGREGKEKAKGSIERKEVKKMRGGEEGKKVNKWEKKRAKSSKKREMSVSMLPSGASDQCR